ncbi:hypothetical protein DM02DRAFT_663998 [Periconia macrospinosa]|uniref:HET-domain-containing protein n=1 Tax=Periconia macrospinosa TaxID=97972 RepID=A0A2V1D0A9_9PLEO|nr:hypothetical protein DM02DRAFT_663998 [Periconia macrospinosa]
MRLLRRCDTGGFSLTQFGAEAILPYAILSHTWGADTEEVTFEDLTNGTGKDKPGYEKIRFCGEQAALDDLEYFWIDTCCIDKRSTDVPSKGEPMSKNEAFASSRWFTRGWTLQELIAPPRALFLDQDWIKIGTKETLLDRITEISGIHAEILASPYDPGLTTIAQKMSWAAGERPLGMRTLHIAFWRKLIKMTHDHSIFAWRGHGKPEHSGFLASSPDDFSDSATTCLCIPRTLEWEPYSWTNLGVRIRLDAVYGEHGSHDRNQFYVILDCCHDSRPNTRIGVYTAYIGGVQRRIRSNELHEVEYTEDSALADQFGEPIYPRPIDYVDDLNRGA